MTDKPDFTDAHRKLARARHHIAAVKNEVIRFLSTDFYRLRLEDEPENRRYKVIFDSLHQPDKGLNAIVGDAISNLRSTLDYAVIALVKPTGAKMRKIQFPNADDAKGFAGEVASEYSLKASTQEMREHFINNVQAYKDGNSKLLWVLNQLRNIDKHRFLVSTAELASMTIECLDANYNRITLTSLIGAGRTTTMMGHYQKITFLEPPRGDFVIEIDEPQCTQKESVIRLLMKIEQQVTTFLADLEALCR
jgi:hypothetical protein